MSEQPRPAAEPAGGASPEGAPRSFHLGSDDVVGGVILLFCAAVFAVTTTFDEVAAMLAQGIPPTQFPRLMVAVIAVLTVVMMVEARRQRRRPRKPVPAMVGLSGGVLVLAVAAMDWIGMMAALFLFCLALPVLWGERRYAWLLAYAVLFPAGIYVLFSRVLEVRFPLGVFETFLD